jgi:hypothetical protein
MNRIEGVRSACAAAWRRTLVVNMMLDWWVVVEEVGMDGRQFRQWWVQWFGRDVFSSRRLLS